jgi:hypothetical protein
MSREWKPGDVAMVTLTTGQTAPAMRSGTDRGEWYAPMRDDSPSFLVGDHLVASAHPLAVIDAGDREQVERLAERIGHLWTSHHYVTDVVQAALREFAAPKPPKPEEPTGKFAAVIDADGREWVRTRDDLPGYLGVVWMDPERFCHRRWDGVDAVRVLSEGVVQP